MDDLWLWIKALHVIAVISWLAGLLYLPRLMVYHAEAEIGSEKSETFKIMERRLLKAIMNPSMIAAWIFGLSIAWGFGDFSDGWFHAKLALVLVLSGFHGMLAKRVREFSRDRNTRSARYFRFINEVPTVIMIIVVVLVIVRPF